MAALSTSYVISASDSSPSTVISLESIAGLIYSMCVWYMQYCFLSPFHTVIILARACYNNLMIVVHFIYRYSARCFCLSTAYMYKVHRYK